MNPQIILLSNNGVSDNNIARLLDFMGIEYVYAMNFEMLLHCIDSGMKCLASSFNAFVEYKKMEEKLYERLSSVLLYGVDSAKMPTSATVEISDQCRDICREFSGLSFTARSNFVPTATEGSIDSQKLISINSEPLFSLKQMGNCRVFFLSTGIVDIQQAIPEQLVGSDYFIQVVPISMFLRYISPGCFNGDGNRYACLIIDDPLLRTNYGFLNYYKLLDLMDAHNIFATIAFIPWNYNRTDKNIADLIKKRVDRFRLCVHGCDHTRGEFGKGDGKYLDNKIRLATARMIEHERKTGIQFDRVMVFPQGIFSTESMEALGKNNYLAAVNTASIPINSSRYLNIADYMESSINKYADFPLFIRNKPNNLINFAFDLFWGKPVFIVIHHNDLKDGYENL